MRPERKIISVKIWVSKFKLRVVSGSKTSSCTHTRNAPWFNVFCIEKLIQTKNWVKKKALRFACVIKKSFNQIKIIFTRQKRSLDPLSQTKNLYIFCSLLMESFHKAQNYTHCAEMEVLEWWNICGLLIIVFSMKVLQ